MKKINFKEEFIMAMLGLALVIIGVLMIMRDGDNNKKND